MTLVEFARPSSLVRESDRPSHFRMVRNGPPGTFVLLQGMKVSLPTDQIVSIEEADGCVRVGFGGMRFVREEPRDEPTDAPVRLRFDRVREMHPESELSPDRSHRMFLDARWVASVHEDERLAWGRSLPPA